MWDGSQIRNDDYSSLLLVQKFWRMETSVEWGSRRERENRERRWRKQCFSKSSRWGRLRVIIGNEWQETSHQLRSHFDQTYCFQVQFYSIFDMQLKRWGEGDFSHSFNVQVKLELHPSSLPSSPSFLPLSTPSHHRNNFEVKNEQVKGYRFSKHNSKLWVLNLIIVICWT